MTKNLIVCIDDDEGLLTIVARALRREPTLEVRTTMQPQQALAWISSEDVAVLVSDYEMPEMTGAQLAGAARRTRPETVRILLTGIRTLEAAVDGINQGEIFRFIQKPFEDKGLRQAVLEGVQRHAELLELSGERARRDRRAAMHAGLEAEYPDISRVVLIDGVIEVTDDPWQEAILLGIVGFDRKLEI